MKDLLTTGDMLAVHARLQGDKLAAQDHSRSMSFALWNERACRLANALLGLGLSKGDRVGILAYNSVEWLEIYAALAKAGLIAVPINFRLVGKEVQYILENAGASALIVQDQLLDLADDVRARLGRTTMHFINYGANANPAGYLSYEDLITSARSVEPDVSVNASDPATLIYTSGTTGNPKGVLHSHKNTAMLALVTGMELKIHRDDNALLVMPMCHGNSLYFYYSFAYAGATTTVHSRKSFDPGDCLKALSSTQATFTSLVPTQYIAMLGLSDAEKNKHQLDHVDRLMISSAPARLETKQATMEMFPNSGLYELYGSTEAAWVTMLHPNEQFTKLGSVGRECIGSAPIRILDEDGNEVPDGQTGELYSNNTYTFEEYWNLPDKTAESFRGDYCSVGDMARRDKDGFIHLVDRKKNLIISGGENIYPSEVEAVVGQHPNVRDVAVIGLPDEKWGERVHAVVVAHDPEAFTENDVLAWCKDRMAGYKRPRSLSFMKEQDMPRTATGKNLHRKLRAQLSKPQTN